MNHLLSLAVGLVATVAATPQVSPDETAVRNIVQRLPLGIPETPPPTRVILLPTAPSLTSVGNSSLVVKLSLKCMTSRSRDNSTEVLSSKTLFL